MWITSYGYPVDEIVDNVTVLKMWIIFLFSTCFFTGYKQVKAIVFRDFLGFAPDSHPIRRRIRFFLLLLIPAISPPSLLNVFSTPKKA